MNDRGGFRLPRGVRLSDTAGLAEGYCVRPEVPGESRILRVAASAERVAEIYLALAAIVGEPGTMAIEVPSHRAVEEELRVGPEDPMHIDVYYLDDLSVARHGALFQSAAELLVGCGLVAFGFGGRRHLDEVWVDVYKTITVRTTHLAPYLSVLQGLGWRERGRLKTAWDTLSRDTPGHREQIEAGGETVHDLIERWEQREGLWFGRRRPDQ